MTFWTSGSTNNQSKAAAYGSQTYKELRWSCIINTMDAMRSWIERQWSVCLPASSDAMPSARQPKPERATRRVTYPFAYKVAAHVKNDRVVAYSYLLEDSLALCAQSGVHHCRLRSNQTRWTRGRSSSGRRRARIVTRAEVAGWWWP